LPGSKHCWNPLNCQLVVFHNISMKIVIVGGSGLIGTKLQPLLRSMGHDVLAVSTRTGVNVLTGEGLDKALNGADVVVDVLNSPSFEAEAVMNFFTTAAGNMLPAEKRAGVKHHVMLSVVRCDRSDAGGYMRAKVVQERAVQASSIPYTIVRATQFFEFVASIAEAYTSKDGTTLLASVMMQPIAADDVAAQLARVAVSPPRNGIVDIAGPEKLRMDVLVRTLLNSMGDTRQVITDETTGYFGDTVDDQSLLPAGEAVLGATTFKNWIAAGKK